MRTAFFAIIIVNIIRAFDAIKFRDDSLNYYSRLTNKYMYANLSTAIVTFAELKDSNPKAPCMKEIQKEYPNVAFSNTTTIMMLLAHGAEGLTRNELLSYFKVNDNISLNNKYLPEYTFLHKLKNVGFYKETAIFVHNSVDLTDDFSSMCKNKFHCSISKLDFRNDVQAAKIINSWAQEITNRETINQISEIIVPDNINKDTKIMLVNIFYFNIKCPKLNGQIFIHKFNISPSKSYSIAMIKFEKSKFIYGEIPHWNAKFIEIQLLSNVITMTIFLANEAIKFGYDSLSYISNKVNFNEFKLIKTTYTNKCDEDIELYLPMFTINSTFDLRYYLDYYHNNGLITMFEDKADFTRLSKTPLQVNNIVKKILVRLRQGSSKVIENKKRNSVKPPKKFIVDQPFMYIIDVNGMKRFRGEVYNADHTTYKIEIKTEL